MVFAVTRGVTAVALATMPKASDTKVDFEPAFFLCKGAVISRRSACDSCILVFARSAFVHCGADGVGHVSPARHDHRGERLLAICVRGKETTGEILVVDIEDVGVRRHKRSRITCVRQVCRRQYRHELLGNLQL